MPQFLVSYFGSTVLHTRLLASAWRPQWRTFNFLICNNGSHYHDRIWLSGKCTEQWNNSLGTNKNICSCSVFLGGAAKSSTDPVRERERGSAQTGSGSFGVRTQHSTPPWCSRKFQCNTTHIDVHGQNMQHTRLAVIALVHLMTSICSSCRVSIRVHLSLFYPGRTDWQCCTEQDSRSREWESTGGLKQESTITHNSILANPLPESK